MTIVSQEKILDIILNFVSFSIFISYIGITIISPTYIKKIEYHLRIYICIFLIIRFNPFYETKLTQLDRKIAFNAGLLILSTTIIGNIKDNVMKQLGLILKG